MTDPKLPADLLTRIIVLIYGLLESGGPCWIYAAVRPSKYQAFLKAQKEGHLNVYDFKPYGEIIVSGEGKSPPDEVTLKVAEMYQTSAAALKQPIDVEKEIKRRADKLA